MTILGVKKFIDVNINKLDGHKSHSLRTEYYAKLLKQKQILSKINKIKNYGKRPS